MATAAPAPPATAGRPTPSARRSSSSSRERWRPRRSRCRSSVPGDSVLSVPGRSGNLPLRALAGNALTPPAVAPPGLNGPLVYVGNGELEQLNGKPIEGAILLMELDSGAGWLRAADFGANALIYVDRGQSPRFLFEDKFELSPLGFPRFWASAEDLARAFGDFAATPGGLVAEAVSLRADAAWENAVSENIVCLIPGSSAERRKEILLVESFYDSTARVAGLSPGADEAIGAVTLLQLARGFKERPPERTVLLVATSGHAQAMAGLRELVWALTARSKDLRDARTDLRRAVQRARAAVQALAEAHFDGGPSRPAVSPPAGGAADGEGGPPEDSGRPAAGGAGGAAQDRGRPRFAAADAAAAGRARPGPAPHPGAQRRARAAAPTELAQLLRRDVGGRTGADGPGGRARARRPAAASRRPAPAAAPARKRRAPARQRPGGRDRRGALAAPVQPRRRVRGLQLRLALPAASAHQPRAGLRRARGRPAAGRARCRASGRRRQDVQGHPAAQPDPVLADVLPGQAGPGRRGLRAGGDPRRHPGDHRRCPARLGNACRHPGAGRPRLRRAPGSGRLRHDRGTVPDRAPAQPRGAAQRVFHRQRAGQVSAPGRAVRRQARAGDRPARLPGAVALLQHGGPAGALQPQRGGRQDPQLLQGGARRLPVRPADG